MKTFRIIGLALRAIILSFRLGTCSSDDDVETTVDIFEVWNLNSNKLIHKHEF